jgi:hypothetical protein
MKKLMDILTEVKRTWMVELGTVAGSAGIDSTATGFFGVDGGGDLMSLVDTLNDRLGLEPGGEMGAWDSYGVGSPAIGFQGNRGQQADISEKGNAWVFTWSGFLNLPQKGAKRFQKGDVQGVTQAVVEVFQGGAQNEAVKKKPGRLREGPIQAQVVNDPDGLVGRLNAALQQAGVKQGRWSYDPEMGVYFDDMEGGQYAYATVSPKGSGFEAEVEVDGRTRRASFNGAMFDQMVAFLVKHIPAIREGKLPRLTQLKKKALTEEAAPSGYSLDVAFSGQPEVLTSLGDFPDLIRATTKAQERADRQSSLQYVGVFPLGARREFVVVHVTPARAKAIIDHVKQMLKTQDVPPEHYYLFSKLSRTANMQMWFNALRTAVKTGQSQRGVFTA